MSQVNEKPSYDTAPAGSIRFNTDSAKMEIYNGEQWWEIDSTSPNEETGGTRGILYEEQHQEEEIMSFNL